MSLRIRLSRGGAKKRPFYRIVVAEGTSPRDGLFIEKLGTYNPMLPKEHADRLVVNADRIKHWISVGAKPTDRVHKMLASIDLMAKFEYRDQPKKSAPGQKRQEREEEEAAKAAAAAEAAAAEAAASAEAAAAPAEEAPAAEAPAEEAPAEEVAAEEEKSEG